MPYQRVRRGYKITGEKRGLYNIEVVNFSLGVFYWSFLLIKIFEYEKRDNNTS